MTLITIAITFGILATAIIFYALSKENEKIALITLFFYVILILGTYFYIKDKNTKNYIKENQVNIYMNGEPVSEKFNISSDTLRYYERVGMIPPVTRTSGGIRDYREEDLRWVELAICTRNADLPIEMMIEYVSLFRKGDSTIPARLDLLYTQMEVLTKQKEQIEETMRRLSYKIGRYEEALKTGKLLWKQKEEN